MSYKFSLGQEVSVPSLEFEGTVVGRSINLKVGPIYVIELSDRIKESYPDVEENGDYTAVTEDLLFEGTLDEYDELEENTLSLS
jgi:hypothetical protein